MSTTYHAWQTDEDLLRNAREMSRRASLSTLGQPARALPGYGADRPTMGVQGRRYDIDDRVSRDLEMEADRLLADAGYDHVRLDVVDRWTFRPEVSPDRVAFKGAVRFRPHACHTSDGKVTRIGDRKRTRNADGTITYGRSVRVLTHSRGENADGSKRRPWHQQVSRCTPRVFVAGPEGTSITWLPRTSITRPDGTAVRFRGVSEHAAWHAPITWRERFIGSRHTTMVRHGSSARPAHRPLGSVWSIDARNIRNRWKKATDEQIARAMAYRTSLVVDGSLILASGATLVIDSDPSVAMPSTDRTRVRVMFGETIAPGESFALVDVVRRAALVD